MIRKILKSKKGLTMVELIIGMVILSIIISMATAVMAPMMQFQRQANELAEQNALLDNLANQIVHDMSKAIDKPAQSGNEITIPIGTGGGGNITYTLIEGIIWRQQVDDNYNVPLLPDGFYRNFIVTVMDINQVPDANGTAYLLTLELSNDRRTFTRDYAVRPIAINHFFAY